jgi:hypothetical protein
VLRRLSSDPRIAREATRTCRATYLAMSALARRRGNYDVADSMHDAVSALVEDDAQEEEDAEATRLEVASNALKIALAKARDAIYIYIYIYICIYVLVHALAKARDAIAPLV